MEFNISKFDPLKKEVFELVENIKTTVASSTGAVGLELLKENKKTLQKKRTSVVGICEAERAATNKYSKDVIDKQREIVGLISEIEKPLDDKIKEIERVEKRKKNLELLPERIEKLVKIEVQNTDTEEFKNILLDMDENQFAEFYINSKEIYVNEQQRKIDEDNQRIENERLAKLAEDKRKKDIADAAEIAAAKAIKDTQEAADKAIADAKAKADKEKQDIIDANNAKEVDRLLKEQRDKEEKEAKELTIKKANEELEKRKKYQNFLTLNRYQEETDITIKSDDGKTIILYRKIAIYKI